MKLINEARRLQQLAGLLTEGEENSESTQKYLQFLYDMIDLGDDYTPGPFSYTFEKQEWADDDLYDNYDMFEPTFQYIKSKGKVEIKGYDGSPIIFTTDGEDIVISFDAP